MSIVARKTDRFAYVLFNRAHAVIDQQTQQVDARLDTREEAETHRDALNAWWSRRPVPGMSFAGSPVFGTLWAETPEAAGAAGDARPTGRSGAAAGRARFVAGEGGFVMRPEPWFEVKV